MKVKNCFLLLITVVFISACFSPWGGDTGKFSISIGGTAGGSGGGRTALPWNNGIEIEKLEHIITLEGPGPEQTETVKGAKTAQFSVVPGVWNITVEAYEVKPDGGEEVRHLTAVGSKTVEIKAGSNGTIKIEMGEPDKGTGGPGTPGLKYELILSGTNTDTYRVTGYDGDSDKVHIPVTFEGKSVTEIGDNAFLKSGLASITIPASVTSIGIAAFANCTNLASITIPEGVTVINMETFSNCSSLTNITIPANVTEIGDGAFYNCTSLKNITIDNAVFANTIGSNWGTIFPASDLSVTFRKNVGEFAFSNCTRLTGVTIAAGVTSIGNSAFESANITGGITIPASVTSIGEAAFWGNSQLTSVTFQGTIASGSFFINSFPGDLYNNYLSGGMGTYTRSEGSETWTKQP